MSKLADLMNHNYLRTCNDFRISEVYKLRIPYVELCLTEIVDPDFFYCHLKSEAKLLSKLMNELQEFYCNDPRGKSEEVKIGTVLYQDLIGKTFFHRYCSN